MCELLYLGGKKFFLSRGSCFCFVLFFFFFFGYVLVSQTVIILIDTMIILLDILCLICFVKSSLNYFSYCIFHTCIYGLFSVFQEFTG